MKRLLSKLFGRSTSSARKVTARPRMQIEALEDRWAPAVSVFTINGGSTLVISGDNAANSVLVRDNADDDLLQVIVGATTREFETSEIDTILVNLRAGNDQFRYVLGGGSDFEHAKNISVSLLAGADLAFFNLANDGEGGAAKIEAPLTINTNTGNQNDQVLVILGKIEDENVNVGAQLGNHNDTFRVLVTGDLEDEARLSINAFGQAGNDVLEVLANNDVFVDDDATFNVNLNGGFQNDFIRMIYQGELDGSMNLRLDGDRDFDTVQAFLTLEDDSDGELQARVLGGLNNDALRLLIQDNSDDDMDILTALLDGGPGNDTQVSTPNVTVVNVP